MGMFLATSPMRYQRIQEMFMALLDCSSRTTTDTYGLNDKVHVSLYTAFYFYLCIWWYEPLCWSGFDVLCRLGC
ncbi:hypothetical protein Hanom_Chr04g00320031 [Helianthus anomalus]